MSRFVTALLAGLLLALVPIAASAQEPEVEFETELGGLGDAAGDLDGTTPEEWEASAAQVEAALTTLRAVATDLDYAELDASLDALEAAIATGDLTAIEAAAADVQADVTALQAAAGDGTQAPTGVATGSEVPDGPNVALLGIAGALLVLAAGALGLRRAPAGR